MKGKTCVVIAFALMFGLVTTNIGNATQNIKILFNGEQMVFDVNPYIRDARTLMPFRKILERLGANVTWDANTKTVTANKNSTIVKLIIGSREAFVNGNLVNLDVSAEMVSGRTFVPLRFISENMGAVVSWDQSTQEISIRNNSEQIVVSMVEGGEYQGVTVKAGIPVKLNFKVNRQQDINGCNRVVVIPKYQISKKLSLGDNIVEFTPTEAGTIPFSCSMGMIESEITVVSQ